MGFAAGVFVPECGVWTAAARAGAVLQKKNTRPDNKKKVYRRTTSQTNTARGLDAALLMLVSYVVTPLASFFLSGKKRVKKNIHLKHPKQHQHKCLTLYWCFPRIPSQRPPETRWRYCKPPPPWWLQKLQLFSPPPQHCCTLPFQNRFKSGERRGSKHRDDVRTRPHTRRSITQASRNTRQSMWA